MEREEFGGSRRKSSAVFLPTCQHHIKVVSTRKAESPTDMDYLHMESDPPIVLLHEIDQLKPKHNDPKMV